MAVTNAHHQPYSTYTNIYQNDPQASINSTTSSAKLIPKTEAYNPVFSTPQNYDYLDHHQAMPSLVDVKHYQGSLSISDSSQILSMDHNFGTSTDFGTGFAYDSTGIWDNEDDDQMIFGEAGDQNVVDQFY